MGWIKDRVPQCRTVLVIQCFRPEGNGWGHVECSWEPLGPFRSPSLGLGETTTQAYVDRAGHAFGMRLQRHSRYDTRGEWSLQDTTPWTYPL